jgi:hypothetical protein
MDGEEVLGRAAQNVRKGSLLTPCQSLQEVIKAIWELEMSIS